MATTKSKIRQQAIKNGYRSGLEDVISKDLKDRGVDFGYETVKINWKLVENKTYTPDFILPNGIIIESKGRFVPDDRKKHLKVREQNPKLDIRFCVSVIVGTRYVKDLRLHMLCGARRITFYMQIKGYPTNGSSNIQCT